MEASFLRARLRAMRADLRSGRAVEAHAASACHFGALYVAMLGQQRAAAQRLVDAAVVPAGMHVASVATWSRLAATEQRRVDAARAAQAQAAARIRMLRREIARVETQLAAVAEVGSQQRPVDLTGSSFDEDAAVGGRVDGVPEASWSLSDAQSLALQLAEEDRAVVQQVTELHAIEAGSEALQTELKLIETQVIELLSSATLAQNRVDDTLKKMDRQKRAIAREERRIEQKLLEIDTRLSRAVQLQRTIDDSTRQDLQAA